MFTTPFNPINVLKSSSSIHRSTCRYTLVNDNSIVIIYDVNVTEWNQDETSSLVVFSGGTAFNSISSSLHKYTPHVAHILPVSDDGGSTAEIVRVLGGPAVGDIRSRCIRWRIQSSETLTSPSSSN